MQRQPEILDDMMRDKSEESPLEPSQGDPVFSDNINSGSIIDEKISD